MLHSERVWRGHLDAALLELHRALRQAPARTTSSSASKSTSAAPPAPSRADLSLLQLHVACHTRNLLRNPAFSRAVNVAAAPLAARRRPWVSERPIPQVGGHPAAPQHARTRLLSCQPL